SRIRLASVCCAKQTDECLAILDLARLRHVERFHKRLPVHFDDLMCFNRELSRLEVRGHEEVYHLGEHSGRAQVTTQIAPLGRSATCLFPQLALRGLQRRLAVVDLACGQLPDVAVRSVAELSQEAHAIVSVERYDRGTARVMNDLELGHVAVRKSYALQVEAHDAA